jgi:hypothetical protein
MKKIILIGVLIVSMIALTACEQSTEDWPTADEMLNNLQKAGYVITEDDKVQVGAVKHKGYVIIAEKDSEFVAGFWGEDYSSAKEVFNYWDRYQTKFKILVDNTVYCGTKEAIKHAGIDLK